MSKNTKVKIYFKSDKDRHVTVKLESRRDVEKLAALVQSEIYRNNYLADLDYKDQAGLVFKIDGKKIHISELLNMLNSALKGEEYNSSNDDEPKKKHKKHKKGKKGKKKKDRDYDEYKLDLSFLKSESKPEIKDDDPELDDNITIVHRI